MSKLISRQILWAFLAIVLCSLAEIGQSENVKSFPDNFKFGAATAAYQVEGGWNASDKTPSIWDHATHTKPEIMYNEATGDVACDSYHQYKRDVEMLRELGVDFYRFSISWTRVLPSGFSDKVSEDGVAYYNNLINELLKYNIEPVITMFHWDLPQRLQDLGGWTNPLILNWFEDYARVLFEKFGDRVKTWATINEPHSICYHGYGATPELSSTAPFVEFPGIAEYLCAYNILRSHSRAYHIYNNEFKSIYQGRVGISVQMLWTVPESDTPDNIQATADYFECRSELYLHPIFSTDGNFPSNCIQKVAAKSAAQGFPRSRLPEFTDEEITSLKGSADFMGVNHYTTLLIYRNSSLEGLYPVPSWLDDIEVGSTISTEWSSTASSWMKVAPWGFRELLNYLSTKYNNVEIIVTENGASSLNGLEDDVRVSYYREYLDALLDAILEDGINVTGYTAWSLMDNFEWNAGYSEFFGLYQVDFEDPERTRTARKSALIYKEIIRSRVINPDYEPSSLDISTTDARL